MKKLVILFGFTIIFGIAIAVSADTSKETITDANGQIIKEIIYDDSSGIKKILNVKLYTYTPSGELVEIKTFDGDGNVILIEQNDLQNN